MKGDLNYSGSNFVVLRCRQELRSSWLGKQFGRETNHTETFPRVHGLLKESGCNTCASGRIGRPELHDRGNLYLSTVRGTVWQGVPPQLHLRPEFYLLL